MVKKFLGEKFMSIGKSLLPKNAREILKDKGVKTITDLEKFSKKELQQLLGGSSTGRKILRALGFTGALGGAGTLGFKAGIPVGQEYQKALDSQKMNKGGIVAPKMGGKPSFKTKKSSKSIAKKYFKGTFQLVELTKAVKHILRKIDSEIESRKNAFADGKIIKDNFEKSVGQVRGLVLAKEIVRETAKNIEELDD